MGDYFDNHSSCIYGALAVYHYATGLILIVYSEVYYFIILLFRLEN